MSAVIEQGWIDLCSLEDIPQLGSRVVMPPSGHPIAVFRTADDAVHALIDKCPHKGGPLSQGIVHGDRVTCPLHAWQVELPTGEVVAPDKGCVKRRAVRVQDGRVQLQG